MALLVHTMDLFPGPAQLFIVCSVWSCSVKLSTAHGWAPHVAALALRTLTALLVQHTMDLFPDPAQLFIVCSVWSCSVKLSTAHGWAPHVAALA